MAQPDLARNHAPGAPRTEHDTLSICCLDAPHTALQNAAGYVAEWRRSGPPWILSPFLMRNCRLDLACLGYHGYSRGSSLPQQISQALDTAKPPRLHLGPQLLCLLARQSLGSRKIRQQVCAFAHCQSKSSHGSPNLRVWEELGRCWNQNEPLASETLPGAMGTMGLNILNP